MLNKNEQNLLKYFVQNQDCFLIGKNLCHKLFISERSLRTYVKNLKPIVSVNGGKIVSKQGKGYQFTIQQQVKFEVFFQKNITNKILDTNDSEVFLKSDRKNYILNLLFLHDKTLFFDDLMKELYVSRSTLSKEFAEIVRELKSYDLTVESRSNKGNYVKGSEWDKRRFIMDYFFCDRYENFIYHYAGENNYFSGIDFEGLALIIIDECREVGINLSDMAIQNIVLHIALSLKRLELGFPISAFKVDFNIINPEVYQVAKNIMMRICENKNFICNDEEVGCLALQLTSKATITKDNLLHFQNEVKQNLLSILKEMDKLYDFPFSCENQLVSGLLEHILQLNLRLTYDMKLDNPFLKQILEDHEDAFLMTKTNLKKLKILNKNIVPDDEWAYLTFHFLAFFERWKDSEKLQVLVICATSNGSVSLLKNRLLMEFSSQIHIVGLCGYYDVSQKDLDNIDLVISAVDLSKIMFAIPIINISVFLRNEDIEKIRNYLEEKKGFKKKALNKQQGVLVRHFITKPFVLIEKGSVSKPELLNKMLSMLSKNENYNYHIKMMEQIKKREYFSTVAFSDTVAVPHPLNPLGNQTKVAIAIVPEGVTWDKSENKIKFVFLISPSRFHTKDLKIITQVIVSFISMQDVQKKLLGAKTREQLKEIFLQWLNQYFNN